jgi:hypothetical protein
MNTYRNIHQDPEKIKALITCGVIAGPLFTVGWIIESATRATYDPLRHPISSLALGDFGWTQVVNFFVAGFLTLAFAIGLKFALYPDRNFAWGSLLIAIWAGALIGAGIFTTDPVSGYPPGTPDVLQSPTIHGALHDQFSLVGFLALTIACFVFTYRFISRGERWWAFYSALTGILFPLGIVLSSAAFGQNESLVAFGGLIQRITISVGWTWLTLLAIDLKRKMSYKEGGHQSAKSPMPTD